MTRSRHNPPRFADLPRDYTGMVALFPLRPIHNAADLDRATELIDAMAGHRLNRDQEDYLDVLSDLVDKHERQRFGSATGDPRRLLAALLEEHGMTASDLGRLLGDRALGSRILNGQRALSKAHIIKLAAHFAIDPGAFIQSATAEAA